MKRTTAVWAAALTMTLSLALAGTGTAAARSASSNRPALPPSAQRQLDALIAARQAGAARMRSALAHPNDSAQDPGDGSGEVAERAAQYGWERSAPALTVPAAAIPAALRAAGALPQAGGSWQELTHQPYDAEPAGFTDPVESNAGAGFGLVGGRMTALAVDGATAYAGAADGGLWRSSDGGRTWTPLGQHLPSLSTGALLIGPAHTVWLGTGEANTSQDEYAGQGVYVSSDRGNQLRKVGGTGLDGSQIFRLADDGTGHVYAATTRGLWRMPSTGWGRWQRVLAPTTGNALGTNVVTDVAIRPGTHGRTVVAVVGWLAGGKANGVYDSTIGGGPGTFTRIRPTGDIDSTDIGRTTLAYAADGSALYALVQSPRLLIAGAATNLQGVFKVSGGNPAGPYRKVATSASLGKSGSALGALPGYNVGVQAWYNQALAVDPTDANRVFVSLEEVFETTNGGKSFTTASQYWNYGLPCGTYCPTTTHPDQHALAITNGQLWIGNDGGVYRRSTGVTGYGHWTDTNATLHTTQYYGVGAGSLVTGGDAYWGGLQDNGTSVLYGATAHTMIEPAGGDGGMVLVDPADGTNAVGEYVYLSLYLTTDGGHSFRTIAPPDAYSGLAQFIAPLTADVRDPRHWVAGGQHIWDDTAGWATVCDSSRCDWTDAHDLGAGNTATALAVSGDTTYAGWIADGGDPGPGFASGIDTNVGGTWHRVSSPVLPHRYVAALVADPTNRYHVYAVYNGFSTRWVQGGGTGHVFESRDGGAHWADISGNLPDIGGDDMVVSHGTLVLATDAGVYTTKAVGPGSWSRFGSGLPNASVNDLTVTPNGASILAATHGRGIWSIQAP